MNELDLIKRVELKIALANSDDALSKALAVYLAPLILKLASPDAQVRGEVISVLDHVNKRLSPAVALPVQKLVDQFQDPAHVDQSLVRSVTLTYIRKGLANAPIPTTVGLVPVLLRNIGTASLQVSQAQFALLLDCLVRIFEEGSELDSPPIDSGADVMFLSAKFTDLFLLDLKFHARNASPGLPSPNYKFLVSASQSMDESRLSKYKKAAIQFFKPYAEHLITQSDTGVSDGPVYFTGDNLYLPLLMASLDRLPEVSGPASSLLSRLRHEPSPQIYETLLHMSEPHYSPIPIKESLRVKIMDVVTAAPPNSIDGNKVFPLIEAAFQSGEKKSSEAAIRLLRSLLHKSRDQHISIPATQARKYSQKLQDFITGTGWPEMMGSQGNSALSVTRGQAYETLGLVARIFPETLTLSLINFLFQSLERDSISMVPSVQQGLSEILAILGRMDDSDRQALGETLFAFLKSSERDAAKFSAVRFAVRALPFNSALGRCICILGTDPTNRSDIVDESRRGLNPHLFNATNSVYGDLAPAVFPPYSEMLDAFRSRADMFSDFVLSPAIHFLFQCFVVESGASLPQDENWDKAFAAAVEIDADVRDAVAKHAAQTPEVSYLIERSFTGLTVANDSNYSLIWLTLLRLSPPTILEQQKERLPALVQLLDSTSVDVNLVSESIAQIASPAVAAAASATAAETDIVSTLRQSSSKHAVTALSYVVARESIAGRDVPSDLVQHLVAQARVNADFDSIYQLAIAAQLSDTSELVPWLVKSGSERAMLALGAFSISAPETASTFITELLSMNQHKGLDALLANGEALSVALAGWQSTALSADLRKLDNESLFSRNSAGADDRFKETITTLFDSVKQTSPAVRRASCVRLLCLVQYTRSFAVPYMTDIQAFFMHLLSDGDEITQESASRGLGLVFDQSDKKLQSELVQSLVSSFTNDQTSRRAMAGTVTHDTQLFEPGVLSTGEGSSVSTYKDILDLASEVGDSTLVYKFMSLASSSKIWSSRRGLAFGLERIMEQSNIDQELVNPDSPVGKKLIPKLFRYRFDPNVQAQKVMRGIWDAIIKDRAKAVIAHFFDSIIRELIESYANREWRVRQATAAALADLIETQQWAQFEAYTEDMWMIGFRLLDDIKDSVRVAGLQMTKALISVLKRRLESNVGNNKELLDTVIPFLLGPKGVHSQSEEVQTFALDTLIKIANSGSKDFQPFAVSFVDEFTLLLSTLEPQTMNYLALNSSNYGVDSNDLDQSRMKSLRQSPMMEALEKIVERLDNDGLKELVSGLPTVVRKSVGLPSKVGAARLIVSVCTRFPTGADMNPLLKVSQNQLMDRNDVVSSSFAVACGYICRLVGHEASYSYAQHVQSLYFAEETSDRARWVAGVALKAFSTYAADRFTSEAKLLFPLAFLGSFDPDKDVAAIFQEVWDSSTGGTGSIKVYFDEIVNTALPLLTSASWSQRQSAAQAISKAAVHIQDKNLALLNSLLEALGGRSWPGKESVFAAMIKVALAGIDDVGPVNERVTTEIKRKNQEYVVRILPSVGEFLQKHPSKDLVELYFSKVQAVLDPEDGAGDVMDDGADDDKKVSEDTKIEVFKTAMASYSTSSPSTDGLYETALLAMFDTWKVKVAACRAMAELGKKGFFSPRVWQRSVETCARDRSHEMVRIEWARAAGALKDFGVSQDVKRATEMESSTIVRRELEKAGFSL